MKRIIMLVAVALVMAAMMLAMALPAFAKHGGSFASEANEEGFGPRDGNNYGHCKDFDPEGPGNGQSTAEWNPSYHGGKDKDDAFNGIICPKGNEV